MEEDSSDMALSSTDYTGSWHTSMRRLVIQKMPSRRLTAFFFTIRPIFKKTTARRQITHLTLQHVSTAMKSWISSMTSQRLIAVERKFHLRNFTRDCWDAAS